MISRKKMMLSMLLAALNPTANAAAETGEQDPKPAPPAPPKDPQSSFEPRNAPGEGQKLMEKFVGEWEVVKTISPPAKEPVHTKGTCRQMMVHGGRFLRSEFVFDEKDGTKTTGEGILGFDASKGIFSSVWTDSRSTRLSLRQSQDKFDGETIVLYGKVLENGGSDPRHSRTVARLEEGGKKLRHQQFIPGPDGKEFVIMELAMTRK